MQKVPPVTKSNKKEQSLIEVSVDTSIKYPPNVATDKVKTFMGGLQAPAEATIQNLAIKLLNSSNSGPGIDLPLLEKTLHINIDYLSNLITKDGRKLKSKKYNSEILDVIEFLGYLPFDQHVIPVIDVFELGNANSKTYDPRHWARLVHKNFGYRCAVTGAVNIGLFVGQDTYKLHVHHLYGAGAYPALKGMVANGLPIPQQLHLKYHELYQGTMVNISTFREFLNNLNETSLPYCKLDYNHLTALDNYLFNLDNLIQNDITISQILQQSTNNTSSEELLNSSEEFNNLSKNNHDL